MRLMDYGQNLFDIVLFRSQKKRLQLLKSMMQNSQEEATFLIKEELQINQSISLSTEIG